VDKTSSAQCAGNENFLALVYIHHYGKRFDGYAGALWSQVQGGLANGFTLATSANTANATATINPTLGFNLRF